MKKLISILLIILILIFTGCQMIEDMYVPEEDTEGSTQSAVNDVDDSMDEIDDLNIKDLEDELDLSELDNLERELDELNW